eukprot:EG_transcript_13198
MGASRRLLPGFIGAMLLVALLQSVRYHSFLQARSSMMSVAVPKAVPAEPPPATADTAPHAESGVVPSRSSDGASPPTLRGRLAYVVLISNEKYVDGALVLGWSLREKSEYIRTRRCDLVLMLPPGSICPHNVQRLQQVGYRIVPVNESLSETNKASAWKGTLNKLYLFNLTDYWKIAYFDADMYALVNPDAIFHYTMPNSSWVVAIVHGKKYFATGAMVLMPDAEVCRQIVAFYLAGARNRSDARGFYGFNARDGLVFRWFIGPRRISLDPAYSSYRSGSLSGLKLFHWAGAWKPWYNRAWRGREVAYLPKEMQGHMEFGAAWRMWWTAYETMHRALWMAENGITYCDGSPYGGNSSNAPAGVIVSPKTHVWMDRYTKWEYVQEFLLTGPSAKPAEKRRPP